VDRRSTSRPSHGPTASGRARQVWGAGDRPARACETAPAPDPPRASRTLTILTAAAALSLGWMILNDHVAPNLRPGSESRVQGVGAQPETAPGPAPPGPSSRRTPLLTGDAARRALAAEAREDVRRRFQQPAFAPGEEPAL
jgi:hypothetical protein